MYWYCCPKLFTSQYIYIYIHTFIPIDQAIYLATRDPCFFSKLWVHEIFLIWEPFNHEGVAATYLVFLAFAPRLWGDRLKMGPCLRKKTNQKWTKNLPATREIRISQQESHRLFRLVWKSKSSSSNRLFGLDGFLRYSDPFENASKKSYVQGSWKILWTKIIQHPIFSTFKLRFDLSHEKKNLLLSILLVTVKRRLKGILIVVYYKIPIKIA